MRNEIAFTRDEVMQNSYQQEAQMIAMALQQNPQIMPMQQNPQMMSMQQNSQRMVMGMQMKK